MIKLDYADANKLIKYYSYGMKNKLQLLCALIRDPKILLLDEPLSSFDIIVSEEIKALLMEKKSQHIILMSTHILQLATDVSDQIVLLRRGEFVSHRDLDLRSAEFHELILRELSDDAS